MCTSVQRHVNKDMFFPRAEWCRVQVIYKLLQLLDSISHARVIKIGRKKLTCQSYSQLIYGFWNTVLISFNVTYVSRKLANVIKPSEREGDAVVDFCNMEYTNGLWSVMVKVCVSGTLCTSTGIASDHRVNLSMMVTQNGGMMVSYPGTGSEVRLCLNGHVQKDSKIRASSLFIAGQKYWWESSSLIPLFPGWLGWWTALNISWHMDWDT